MPLAISQLKDNLKKIFDTAATESWTTEKVADEMLDTMKQQDKAGSLNPI